MEPLDEGSLDILLRETADAPSQIGSLGLLGQSHSGATATLSDITALLSTRAPAAHHARQRLVQVPLQPDQAFWADDEHFSIQRHLIHHDQSGVRSLNGLLELCARLTAQKLPRDRPLWQAVFVDGLRLADRPDVRAALLVVVHEILVEESSGEQVMDFLLDFEADEAREIQHRPFDPRPLPSRFAMLTRSPLGLLQTPLTLAGKLKDHAASSFYRLLFERLSNLPLPGRLLLSPAAPFNRPVTDRRTAVNLRCTLQELQTLKSLAPGVTINDLILTLTSMIIERWTSDGACGRRQMKGLIALEPVSVRSTRLNTPVGSELTAMLIDLSIDQSEPAARLAAIHDNALASQIYQQAISASRLRHVVPSSMLGLAARVYGEFQLAQQHKPLFNLPVTNIPGPDQPLYLGSFPVPDKLGLTPLFNNLGLAVVVISYSGHINFTLHYCPDLLPSGEGLDDIFSGALSDLKDSLRLAASQNDGKIQYGRDLASDLKPSRAGLLGDLKRIFSGLARNSLAEATLRRQRLGNNDQPEETATESREDASIDQRVDLPENE